MQLSLYFVTRAQWQPGQKVAGKRKNIQQTLHSKSPTASQVMGLGKQGTHKDF